MIVAAVERLAAALELTAVADGVMSVPAEGALYAKQGDRWSLKAEAGSVPSVEFAMAQLVMMVFQGDPVVETAVLVVAAVHGLPWDRTDVENVDEGVEVVEVASKDVQRAWDVREVEGDR
jgi:hypothetical protein